MKAKSVSLWVILLAGIWVAALSVARAAFPAMTGAELGLGVPEIIATGVFFVVIFTPVYRSIWLDKKLGAQVEEAKVNGASMDRLLAQLSAALEKSLSAQNEAPAGIMEVLKRSLMAQDYEADKDKPSGQEPQAAGVAMGG